MGRLPTLAASASQAAIGKDREAGVEPPRDHRPTVELGAESRRDGDASLTVHRVPVLAGEHRSASLTSWAPVVGSTGEGPVDRSSPLLTTSRHFWVILAPGGGAPSRFAVGGNDPGVPAAEGGGDGRCADACTEAAGDAVEAGRARRGRIAAIARRIPGSRKDGRGPTPGPRRGEPAQRRLAAGAGAGPGAPGAAASPWGPRARRPGHCGYAGFQA